MDTPLGFASLNAGNAHVFHGEAKVLFNYVDTVNMPSGKSFNKLCGRLVQLDNDDEEQSQMIMFEAIQSKKGVKQWDADTIREKGLSNVAKRLVGFSQTLPGTPGEKYKHRTQLIEMVEQLDADSEDGYLPPQSQTTPSPHKRPFVFPTYESPASKKICRPFGSPPGPIESDDVTAPAVLKLEQHASQTLFGFSPNL